MYKSVMIFNRVNNKLAIDGILLNLKQSTLNLLQQCVRQILYLLGCKSKVIFLTSSVDPTDFCKNLTCYFSNLVATFCKTQLVFDK